MLPIHQIIWHETFTKSPAVRVNEPTSVMNDKDQVNAYVESYKWGGATSTLQLYHLTQLSRLIKPNDVVLDLACGPGPLLLELASLYPDTQFIGVDLSDLMLEHLVDSAKQRGLKNVTVLKDNIATLELLEHKKVDLIISTSALHHLPSQDLLEQTFKCASNLIHENGGFYFFDFGLLKSAEARRIIVKDIAKHAHQLTVLDYDMSLQAAFPIDHVITIARKYLRSPIRTSRSAFVNFFYFLKSDTRTHPDIRVNEYINMRWRNLSLLHKIEYFMLNYFQSKNVF